MNRLSAATRGHLHSVHLIVGSVLSLMLVAGPARAALFDDDEARKAILDLRARVTQNDEQTKARMSELTAANARLTEQINALRGSLLDLNNQLEVLRSDMARLRGGDEQTQRALADLQKLQKDLGQAASYQGFSHHTRERSLYNQELRLDSTTASDAIDRWTLGVFFSNLDEDTAYTNTDPGNIRGLVTRYEATQAALFGQLAEAGFTRSDVVVGLGGGSTTDLAGFVAASFLRGVDYVSVPTTLLAMVDAAVGGKTGINLRRGKNLVGAFYEPVGVLCDLDLLAALPPAEVSSGMAEIVKAGFIRDARITELVAQDPADALDVRSVRLAELVRRAIGFKADVVTADLREATTAAWISCGTRA